MGKKPTDDHQTRRAAAVDAALAAIEKKYGDGAIMRGDDNASRAMRAISSSNVVLDRAMGIGGYPVGRIIEIYGPESSGKTTLALHAIAEVQASGGLAAFIDAEHALDPEYARNLGVKLGELLISQPDNGEQALEIADTLARSGAAQTQRCAVAYEHHVHLHQPVARKDRGVLRIPGDDHRR